MAFAQAINAAYLGEVAEEHRHVVLRGIVRARDLLADRVVYCLRQP